MKGHRLIVDIATQRFVVAMVVRVNVFEMEIKYCLLNRTMCFGVCCVGVSGMYKLVLFSW